MSFILTIFLRPTIWLQYALHAILSGVSILDDVIFFVNRIERENIIYLCRCWQLSLSINLKLNEVTAFQFDRPVLVRCATCRISLLPNHRFRFSSLFSQTPWNRMWPRECLQFTENSPYSACSIAVCHTLVNLRKLVLESVSNQGLCTGRGWGYSHYPL